MRPRSAATCERCSRDRAWSRSALGVGGYILANQRLRFPLRRGQADQAEGRAADRPGGDARARARPCGSRACRSARSARSELSDGTRSSRC